MKKAIRHLLILLFIAGCGFTPIDPSKESTSTEVSPELKLFWHAIEPIVTNYIEPVTCHSLMVGAVQGFEELVGDTNLLTISHGQIFTLSPKTHDPVEFTSGSKENIHLLLRELLNIVDYAKIRYSDHSSNDVVVSLIKGMVSALDDRSALWTPSFIASMKMASTTNARPGLILDLDDDYPLVVGTYCDAPAQKSGITAGDRIIAVNGISTKGWGSLELKSRLRGQPGDRLKLEVKHEKANTSRTYDVPLLNLPDPSVYLGVESEGYVYIWIRNFSSTTSDELSSVLKEVEETSPLRGIVMDLRFNPGGIMNQVIEVADRFMDGGIIAEVKSRTPRFNRLYKASRKEIINKYKMIILVNGATASGAEIVSAAFQDSEIALVLGEPTRGMREIAAISSLPMGYALKLTVAKSYRPFGYWNAPAHIQPDIFVEAGLVDDMGDLCNLGTDALSQKALKILKQSPSAEFGDLLRTARNIK